MAIHEFTPTKYWTTLGTYEPALRIADGDSVITTTVDAAGRDSRGEPVTVGGNPQTGPFYVEGAEPGDTLSVRFDRLSPNRSQGISATRLAPNVVDPWDVLDFPKQSPLATWEVDTETGTVILVEPQTKLGKLRLLLRPMLGCFGVAASGGQAISTATSGPHGGNMDYPGFVEGVTVHFPVFAEGALFFLGDGHALQGDGEIVGTGIEISFDVQFTVNLIKGQEIRWPRGESETHVFTVGNARPLEQALQHATSEMVRWLKQDWELDDLGIHTLLGQAVEYDVGNVYDPAFTMVCKLNRQSLDFVQV
jgi:amidase